MVQNWEVGFARSADFAFERKGVGAGSRARAAGLRLDGWSVSHGQLDTWDRGEGGGLRKGVGGEGTWKSA